MTETNMLDRQEDDYADSLYCASCPLPKQIALYEQGLEILSKQLVELQAEFRKLADKIDTTNAKRAI